MSCCFKIFSFSTILCQFNYNMSWSGYAFVFMGVLCASWTWISVSFPKLEKFSTIISSKKMYCSLDFPRTSYKSPRSVHFFPCSHTFSPPMLSYQFLVPSLPNELQTDFLPTIFWNPSPHNSQNYLTNTIKKKCSEVIPLIKSLYLLPMKYFQGNSSS